MAINNRAFTTALVIVLCGCLLQPVHGQGPCASPACHNGLAVGCAPRRVTYGYFETHWRRWPTDAAAAAPTPATEPAPAPAEPTPTPGAEEATPRIEPEQPEAAPDETILTPTEPAAPETEAPPAKPPVAPDTMLPFEEQPPPAPTESPQEPGVPSTPAPNPTPELPGLPSAGPPLAVPPGSPSDERQLPSPPADDAPPTMPNDDPFKDDPAQPGAEPEAPAAKASDKQTRRTETLLDSAEKPALARWRSVAAAGAPQAAVFRTEDVVNATAGVARIAAGKEPTLLQLGAERAGSRDRMLPGAAPARKNPLRLAAISAGDAQVAPTAAWSADESASGAPLGGDRRNPLRDN